MSRKRWLGLIALIVLGVLIVAALVAVPFFFGRAYFPGGPFMRPGIVRVGLPFFGGGLLMLFFWILLIAGAVWLLASGNRHVVQSNSGAPVQTPLDILKVRYARGEITKEQYDQMRRDLEG